MPDSTPSTPRTSSTTRWQGWYAPSVTVLSGKASTILVAALLSCGCRIRGAMAPTRQSSETLQVARHNSPRKRSTASTWAGTAWRLASGLGVDAEGSQMHTTAEMSSRSLRVKSPVSNRHQSHDAVGRVKSSTSMWLSASRWRISRFQSLPAERLAPDTKHSIVGERPSSACWNATASVWFSCLWLTKI